MTGSFDIDGPAIPNIYTLSDKSAELLSLVPKEERGKALALLKDLLLATGRHAVCLHGGYNYYARDTLTEAMEVTMRKADAA